MLSAFPLRVSISSHWQLFWAESCAWLPQQAVTRLHPCLPLLTLVSVLAYSACLCLLLGVTNRSPCVLQGATSTSTASSACLSLNASVSGLGPAFKLTLDLCNTGSQPLLGTALVSPLTADVALHMGPNLLHRAA